MRVKLIFTIAGLVLAATLVMMAYGTPKTNRVSIHYAIPKNPLHQAIYEQMVLFPVNDTRTN
jgi:hypothetical protein